MITSVALLCEGECVAFSAIGLHRSWIDTYELGRMMLVMQRLGHSDFDVEATDENGAKVEVWWNLSHRDGDHFFKVEEVITEDEEAQY
jgi:hypothetical protein